MTVDITSPSEGKGKYKHKDRRDYHLLYRAIGRVGKQEYGTKGYSRAYTDCEDLIERIKADGKGDQVDMQSQIGEFAKLPRPAATKKGSNAIIETHSMTTVPMNMTSPRPPCGRPVANTSVHPPAPAVASLPIGTVERQWVKNPEDGLEWCTINLREQYESIAELNPGDMDSESRSFIKQMPDSTELEKFLRYIASKSYKMPWEKIMDSKNLAACASGSSDRAAGKQYLYWRPATRLA